MKQFFLLISVTIAAGIAAPYHPFWGLLLYYGLAVLRPQYIWDWALPDGFRWSLYAAAIVMIGVLLNTHRIILRGRVTPATWLIIAYGVMLLVSCLTAHHPSIAFAWGQEHAKILLIALIAMLFIDQLWQIRVMAVMALAMIGYIAWEINSMYFFQGGRLDVFHRGYGGLDNNGAGLLLTMGLPLAYAFGVSASKRWQQLAAWFIGLVLLHAVMMTYSRGAMLAAVVGLVYLLTQHRGRMQAASIALVACLAISFLAGPEIRERFASTGQYRDDQSAQSRLDSWAAAWAMAWEHPVTGQGIRNSNLYSENYGADRHGRTIHSIYLQIAADSGIIAAGLYIALLVFALMALQRSRRICRDVQLRTDVTRGPPGSRDVAEQYEALSLGLQGSLVVFAFGAVFLSVEVFELPWLLMVLAAALPGAAARELAGEAEEKRDTEHALAGTRPPHTPGAGHADRRTPDSDDLSTLPHGNHGWIHG